MQPIRSKSQRYRPLEGFSNNRGEENTNNNSKIKFAAMSLDGTNENGTVSKRLKTKHTIPELKRADPFSTLPREITLLILSYMDPKSLCRASQVCFNWYDAADDAVLWLTLLTRYWPMSDPTYELEKNIDSWKAIFGRRMRRETLFRAKMEEVFVDFRPAVKIMFEGKRASHQCFDNSKDAMKILERARQEHISACCDIISRRDRDLGANDFGALLQRLRWYPMQVSDIVNDLEQYSDINDNIYNIFWNDIWNAIPRHCLSPETLEKILRGRCTNMTRISVCRRLIEHFGKEQYVEKYTLLKTQAENQAAADAGHAAQQE